MMVCDNVGACIFLRTSARWSRFTLVCASPLTHLIGRIGSTLIFYFK